MRYKSAFSTSPDPYEAGTEIGESLAEVHPEVVLLFSAIHYTSDSKSFFDGLSDALDDPRAIVFGCTGDGVYETGQAANHAVSALGLDSGGAMTWSCALKGGVGEDSRGAARACAEEALAGLGGPADFCLAFADGSTADGTGIAEGLASAVSCPLLGGLAADERKFQQSRLYQDRKEHRDAVGVLLGRGPLRFALNAASGWAPSGSMGTVQTRGSEVLRIDDRRPIDFVTTQMHKPMGQLDIGMISLAAYVDGEAGPFFLRSTDRIDDETGSFRTFGSMAPGTRVKLCSASREDVLRAAREAVQGLLEGGLGFEPKAAVVVSCAGRKWLLEDRVDRELEAVFEALGRRIPLVGFPSYGEIAPFRRQGGGYTRSYFHNVTFALCLLGA